MRGACRYSAQPAVCPDNLPLVQQKPAPAFCSAIFGRNNSIVMNESLNNPGFEGNPRKPLLPEALKYALISGLLFIALAMVGFALGISEQHLALQLLGWVLYVAIPFVFLSHYKNKINKGFLSFGQGVGLSALTGLLLGVLMGIFIYMYAAYINPDMIVSIEDKAIEDMRSQGLSDDQIESSMAIAGMFISPGFFAISSLISMPLIFTIVGLIASAILKRD